MSICVNIWAANQVEWPRPIRSELHVESLKRPKHAVHDEWLGILLMTRIKTNILLLGIEFYCTKSIL